jgi:hypothetical protein
VLIAGAAVIAAALAAWTANRRIDKQLDEESGRLDRQLAHDRKMRDRDALRQMLDDALRAVGEGIEVLEESARERSDGYGLEGEVKLQWGKALDQATSELKSRARRNWVRVHAEAARLRLRFGTEHDIMKCYEGMIMMLGGAGDAEFDSRKLRQLWAHERRVELDEAISEFVRVCRPYVGVQDDRS